MQEDIAFITGNAARLSVRVTITLSLKESMGRKEIRKPAITRYLNLKSYSSTDGKPGSLRKNRNDHILIP